MTTDRLPPPDVITRAVQQAGIGYALTDRHGVILDMSESFRERTGLDPDRAASRPWYELDELAEDRSETRRQSWEDFIASSETWNGILIWHLPDGTIRHFEATAMHIEGGKVIIVINDRTEMVEATRRVDDMSKLLQQTLRDLPLAVGVTDNDGKLTYINEYISRRFNMPSTEMIGKTLSEVFGNGLSEMSRHVADTYSPETDDESEGILANLTLDNGEIGTWLLFARPLFNSKGERVSTLNVAVDHTELRRLQDAHTALIRSTHETQKAFMLNNFAGTLTHELSNILHPVAFYARRLARNPGSDQAGTYAEKINNGVLAAGDLLRRSRQLAGGEAAETCDIAAIVEETVASARDLAPARLHYVSDFAPGPHLAEVNRAEMQQVLLNLLNNAAEAMHHRGTITISLRQRERDKLPLQLASAAGPMLQLTIADEGPGVDPAILDRVFDPFVTTKPMSQGTGLDCRWYAAW